jgi:integrase
MQGSLRKKGDSWYYRIDLGIVDGKRKQIERYAGKTKGAAGKALHKVMQQLDQTGIYYEPSETSYADFLDKWLERNVKINCSLATYGNYKTQIKNHIKPAVGAYQLKQLSPMALQDFVDKLKTAYSKNTVQLIMNIMRSSLSAAVQPYQYIADSPMKYVKLPKFKKTELETAKVFTDNEMKELLNHFDIRHQFFIPIRIAYRTGMRMGECLALTWDNIDMENRVIHVRYTLADKVKGQRTIVPPKSQNSVRDISFDDELFKALKTKKIHQSESKLKYGEFYTQTPFVCTHENGTPVSSDDMRYFGYYCRTILKTDKSFHCLRHTHATALLENGATLEYVSKRLGHSTLSITANTYIHVTDKMNEHAVDILNKAFVK